VDNSSWRLAFSTTQKSKEKLKIWISLAGGSGQYASLARAPKGGVKHNRKDFYFQDKTNKFNKFII